MDTKFNDPQANAEKLAGHDTVQKAVSYINTKSWMQNAEEKNAATVSANERTSLNALIAYVAMQSGENEFRVERRLSDRFNIANMTCLPATQYDEAIRYLVDGLPTGFAE